MQHLNQQILSRYIGGDLPEQELNACHRHLADCDSCRHDLAFVVRLLDENVFAEEMALLDSVEAKVFNDRVVPKPAALRQPYFARFFGWLTPNWKLAAVAASLAIVALAFVFIRKDGSETILRVDGSPRTFEARISHQPYSEFIRTRAGSPADNTVPDNDAMRRLNINDYEAGRFYLQHDNFSKAIVNLEHATQAQPNSAEICNDLGVAYMENAGDGSLEKALGEFQRALQLNPAYEPALFNLALVYERLGNFPDAERQLRRYLQIDSDSDWAKEVESKLRLWKH